MVVPEPDTKPTNKLRIGLLSGFVEKKQPQLCEFGGELNSSWLGV